MTTHRDIENAVQLISAHLRGDSELELDVVRRYANDTTGALYNAIVGLATSSIATVASMLNMSPEAYLDCLLMEAARNTAISDEEHGEA